VLTVGDRPLARSKCPVKVLIKVPCKVALVHWLRDHVDHAVDVWHSGR